MTRKEWEAHKALDNIAELVDYIERAYLTYDECEADGFDSMMEVMDILDKLDRLRLAAHKRLHRLGDP